MVDREVLIEYHSRKVRYVGGDYGNESQPWEKLRRRDRAEARKRDRVRVRWEIFLVIQNLVCIQITCDHFASLFPF